MLSFSRSIQSATNRTLMRYCLSLLLSLAVTTGSLSAQESAGRAVDRKLTPLLSISSEGCDSWLVDPKDQPMREALRLLGPRLRDLPGELPDFDVPPEVVDLAVSLLGGPMSLTVAESSRAIAGMPLPLAVDMRLVQPTPEAASARAQEVAALLGNFGVAMDSPIEGESWVIPAPVPLWMGHDGSDLHLRLGLQQGLTPPSQQHLLPEGARMAFSGMIDYGSTLELLGSIAGNDQDFQQLMGFLEAFGLEDLQYEWAMGSDDTRGHLVLNLPGWAGTAADLGLLSDEVLDPSTVAMIPEDATWATAMTFNLEGVYGLYRGLLEDLAGIDLDQMILQEAGLDFQAEIIEPLGNSVAIYASDSTGGGGLLSTVVVIELEDTAAFLKTWGRLERFTNRMGRKNLNGYLRFSHYDQAGLDLGVLSFSGIPVPLEITVTTVEGYCILGMTPQSVHAAAAQITGADRSLLDNPDFQMQLAADMSGVVSLSWINTPRLMRDGYGLTSLMTSAMANMMRSPGKRSREPGMIMPAYNELKEGAMGILSIGRRRGDDLRSETRADRSAMVNITGVMGYVSTSPIAAIAGMAVVAGALGSDGVAMADELMESGLELDDVMLTAPDQPGQSYEDRVAEDFVAIFSALDAFAQRNGGRYPDSLQILAIPDQNGNSYLDSRHLIDPWGDAYLYTPPSAENPEPELDLKD